MIEITRYEEKYLDSLKKMMLQENITFEQIELCLNHTYIILERDEVLGFGYYNIYDEKVFIDHLYVKKNERLNHLGDSLFRAILNSLFLMQVKTVYMRVDALYDDFLTHEDLYPVEGTYEIVLDQFFSRKCKSEKAKKTPLQ